MTSLREVRNSLIKVHCSGWYYNDPFEWHAFWTDFQRFVFRSLIFLAGNVDMFVPWSMAFWTSLPKTSEETNTSSCPNFPANKWESLSFYWKVSKSSLYIYSIFLTMLKAQPQQRDIFLLGLPKWSLRWCFFFREKTQIYQRQSIGTSATPNGATVFSGVL